MTSVATSVASAVCLNDSRNLIPINIHILPFQFQPSSLSYPTGGPTDYQHLQAQPQYQPQPNAAGQASASIQMYLFNLSPTAAKHHHRDSSAAATTPNQRRYDTDFPAGNASHHGKRYDPSGWFKSALDDDAVLPTFK